MQVTEVVAGVIFRQQHTAFVLSFLYVRHYSFSIRRTTSMTSTGKGEEGVREQICVAHKDPFRYRTRAQ